MLPLDENEQDRTQITETELGTTPTLMMMTTVDDAGEMRFFPFNKDEWNDTDGDGIGDNSDDDADGDGWTNEQENQTGETTSWLDNGSSLIPTETVVGRHRMLTNPNARRTTSTTDGATSWTTTTVTGGPTSKKDGC